jgi:hypothetical protein
MTRWTTVAALLVGYSALLAQTVPDFSGRWVLDVKRTQALTESLTMTIPVSPVTLPDYQITQTNSAITIDRVDAASPQSYTYRLDGSESLSTVGTSIARTKSRWEGRTLIVEGTRSFTTSPGEVRSTFRHALSLDKDGDMVVEQVDHIVGQPISVMYQVFVRRPKS